MNLPVGTTQALAGLAVAAVVLVATVRVVSARADSSSKRDTGSNTPVSSPTDAGDNSAAEVPDSAKALVSDDGRIHAERTYSEPPARFDRKQGEFPRARELQEPTGFINTEPISIGQYVGEKVILIEFWTFGCYNCQNTHPHIQQYSQEYADDGLLVVGIHYPEFDRERKRDNVEAYVEKTETTYPVVLDNDGRTWRAYDQKYWPARYLIDIDGFIRYGHTGEGGYEETEQMIRTLLAERE
jgi:thiol-disulfide isomerase/thioredoxin